MGRDYSCLELSNEESVLYNDENTAIVIGLRGHPSRLIATYGFSPVLLSAGLRVEFRNLKSVILSDFSETDPKQFHEIPQWLATLCQIESLAMSNAELSNITFCEEIPLEYFDLQKVQRNDTASVLRIIGNLKRLKIFVHDESFSDEDISILKEKLPNTKFASKRSGKTER